MPNELGGSNIAGSSDNGGAGTQERRKIGEVVERARTQVEDVTDRAKSAAETLDRRLSTKMQENPLLVLGAAVGVGYVFGRVFSRMR